MDAGLKDGPIKKLNYKYAYSLQNRSSYIIIEIPYFEVVQIQIMDACGSLWYFRVDVKKRAVSNKLRSLGIYTDAKVIRGPDWNYGNQDGKKSSHGQAG